MKSGIVKPSKLFWVGIIWAGMIAIAWLFDETTYQAANLPWADQKYLPIITNNAFVNNIWQPRPGTSWQIQFTGTIDTSFDVDMYDLDLFDTPANLINQLHSEGRKVVCYFSAGSWEAWREDADLFPDSVKGNDLEGWPGEKWLDVRQISILGPIMAARLDKAAQKGCDGVDPDNMDGYANDSGFPLTPQEQITYNTWIASQSHQRGLAVGLKNDVDQIQDLVSYFDWQLNEECFYYNECNKLLPFVQANKAVFGIEYELQKEDFCAQANALNFDFLIKKWDLDAWRVSCR